MKFCIILIFLFLNASAEISPRRACRSLDTRCGTPTCNDNNVCTTDTVSGSSCVYTPINCVLSSKCFTYGCNPTTGCTSSPINCTSSSQCYNYGCDPNTGCTATPKNCDQSSKCYTYSCNPSTGCISTALNCNFASKCFTYGCDPSTGCTATPINCDDFDSSTADSCNDTTGCVHVVNSCDDSNPCTLDQNQSGTCVHTPVSCNAGNACTNNTCDPTSTYNGCKYPSLADTCKTGNKCYAEGCDVSNGCYAIPVNCNDGNACTIDTCEPAVGCTYSTVNCDDNNACTSDSCNPATGCVHAQLPCAPLSVCQESYCNTSVGCIQVDKDCDDNNVCTEDSCDPATGCNYTNADCNDDNLCTQDSCIPNIGCNHTTINCDDKNSCTIDSCDPLLGCSQKDVVCNDDDPCTVDSCNILSGCTHTLANFNYGQSCAIELTTAQSVTLNSTSAISMNFPAASGYNVSYGVANPSNVGYQDPRYSGPGIYLNITFFINFYENSTGTHIPPIGTFITISGITENASLYYYDLDTNQWTRNCYEPTFDDNNFKVELCHATQYALFETGNDFSSVSSGTSQNIIHGKSAPVIAMAVVIPTVAFVGIGAAFLMYRKKKKSRDGESQIELSTTLPIIKGVTVISQLGEGNFGEVYKGEWKGTFVALKKLKSSSPQDYEEFAKESKMLFNISHPNIVQFMGIYENERHERFIVTEFMAGGDLLNLVRNSAEKIDIHAMIDMARQAASGMVYLQDKNILHRDLALRNLLVSETASNQFVVKVSDFGLSRAINGTVSYYQKDETKLPVKWSAPESLQYYKFSTKSDVWSFGVCLWELFSRGETPYCTMSNVEAMDNILNGYRLPQPRTCPNTVYEIMLACWHINAEDRLGFEEILNKLVNLQKNKESLSVTQVPKQSVNLFVNNNYDTPSIRYN